VVILYSDCHLFFSRVILSFLTSTRSNHYLPVKVQLNLSEEFKTMSVLYYTTNNSVFTNFAFYATASVVKMMGMSALTVLKRMSKEAFANPEDLSYAKNKSAVVSTDPDVERIRRNHLNDIENIVPFVLVGFLYVGTNPDRDLALWHFRIFFVSRLLHTLTYQLALPQPSRTISCIVGYLATLSMAARVLLTVRP